MSNETTEVVEKVAPRMAGDREAIYHQDGPFRLV